MNKKLKKVRDKIEDGIVRGYNWVKDHPVITAIGTTIVGSAITGVVSYRSGCYNGAKRVIAHRLERQEAGLGESFTLVQPGTRDEEGIQFSDKSLKEIVDEGYGNYVYGVGEMRLKNGQSVYIERFDDDVIVVLNAKEEFDVTDERVTNAIVNSDPWPI